MNCPKCNAEIPAGKNFCVECGEHLPEQPQVRKCAKCGAAIPDGKNFCVECGSSYAAAPKLAAKARRCTKCNAKIPAGKNFCVECGERLPEEKTPSDPEASRQAAASAGTEAGGKRPGTKKSWPLWIMYAATALVVLFSILIFVHLESHYFLDFGPFRDVYGKSGFALQLIGLSLALLPLILLPFFSWKGRIVGIAGAVVICLIMGTMFFWQSDEYVRRDISVKHDCVVRREGSRFYISRSYYTTRDDIVLMMKRGKNKSKYSFTDLYDLDSCNFTAQLFLYWHKKTGKSLAGFLEDYWRAREESKPSYYYGKNKEEECKKHVISRFCNGIRDGDRFAVWCCLLPSVREKTALADLEPHKIKESDITEDYLIERNGFYYISEEAVGPFLSRFHHSSSSAAAPVVDELEVVGIDDDEGIEADERILMD